MERDTIENFLSTLDENKSIDDYLNGNESCDATVKELFQLIKRLKRAEPITVGQVRDILRKSSSLMKFIRTPDGNVKLGKVAFNCSEVYGHDTFDSVLYLGKYDSKEVVVRHVPLKNYDDGLKEVERMKEYDYSNLIRFVGSEEFRCCDVGNEMKEEGLYICIEKPRFTLTEYTATMTDTTRIRRFTRFVKS